MRDRAAALGAIPSMLYRFGEFQVDLANGFLARGSEEIPVRRKVYQVLVALIERQDRLVSKEELFATVWPDTAVTDDVLAGVLKELRKALGDNPKEPRFIRTIPRAGYRFIGAAEPVRPETEAVAAPPAEVAAAMPPPTPVRSRRVWVPAMLIIGVLGGWLALKGTLVRPGQSSDSDLNEVAWWRFEEASGNQIVDSSGSGNTGVAFGGVSHAPGRSGLALSLDGRTGYVQGTNRAFPSNDSSRSATAWIRTSSTNGDTTQLFFYGEHALAPGFAGLHAASAFSIAMRMDGTLVLGPDIPGWGVHTRTRVDDGVWHHIAATWNGPASVASGRVYIDGKEEASGKVGPFATVAGAHWGIGGVPQATLFRGEIDDLRVFNGALSALQVRALHRCSSGVTDLEIDGKPFYFLPIWGAGAEVSGGQIRNAGKDTGGVQFAQAHDGCSLDSLRGTDAGQDLRIEGDLLVPTDTAGHVCEAGPYFRSRRAAPGDGLIGGTSAGFWVALFSSGSIVVQRMNPAAVVAFAAIPDFDATVFHHLEMAAVGRQLQVAVDGQLIRFDQEGRQTQTVSIAPLWEGPPVIGYNRGTAGIAFWARQNRGEIGGQIVKGIRVERATGLIQP